MTWRHLFVLMNYILSKGKNKQLHQKIRTMLKIKTFLPLC